MESKRFMKNKVFWFRLDGHKGEAILFKYSPKYIYDLIIDGSGHTTQKWVSKVKSLRIVKSFSAFPLLRIKKKRNCFIPFLLNLLQRQRNTLKDIRGVDQSILKYFPGKSHYVLNTENLGSWKSFFWLVNLKSLRVVLEREASADPKAIPIDLGKIASQIQRFATHLRRLKKLKHVDLCVEKELSKMTGLIFSKLNCSQDILKMLTSLRIKMKALKPTQTHPEDCPFLEIFQYATEFEFQDTQNVPPDYITKYFGKFANLVALRLTLPVENYISHSQPSHMSLEYLRHIGGLEKLTELKISLFWFTTEYTAEFFRYFNAPTSLQKFYLTIVSPKWSDLIQTNQVEDWEIHNPFENSDLLAPFYQKWEHLKNFQSLNIRLENSNMFMVPNIAFIIPLLRRIVYLKELVFEALVTSSPGLQKKSLQWSYLWKTISHLRADIETLVVKEAAISLKNFEWQPQELNMKRLEIGKYVLGEKNINSLIKLLKKKGKTELEECLVIDQFIVENDECLAKFLESFVKLSPNIKLTMSADLRNVNKDTLVRDLLQYVPRIRKNNGLDITFVNVSKSITKDDLKMIRTTLISHPAFCYLEIMSRGGHTIYLFDRKYHTKEKTEALMKESGPEFNTWIAEHDISDASQHEMEEEDGDDNNEEEEEEEIDSEEIEDSDFDCYGEFEETDCQDPAYKELEDIDKA